MKYKVFSAALLLSALQIPAQIFNSGFEDNNGTPLSEYKKINRDGLSVPAWAEVQDFNDNAWIQFYDGFDNKIAFSTSWYDPDGKSDDWLVTPQISIPAGGAPTLYWKAKSYDDTAPDSYDVMVSETDNDPASFKTVLSVDGEQAYEFADHTVDLSEYAGKKIFVAFVNNTDGGYYLALDDLYISNTANCVMPDMSGFTVSNLAENSFTVNFGATSGIQNYDVGITTFTKPVSSSGIQAATTKSFANLQPATRYQLFLKNADCGSGWAGPKSVFTPTLLPYSYDFEPTKENYGEYDSDGWTSDTWLNGTGNAQQGDGYAFNNTSKSYDKNDWLFSYPIKLTAGEKITVKYFAEMGSAAATPGSLAVSIASAPDKAKNIATIGTQTISGNTYTEYSAEYTAPDTGIYYVGFGNVTPKVTTASAMRLDNIRITSSTLSTAAAMEKKLHVYPNPVKDILNIEAPENVLSAQIWSAEGRLLKQADGDIKSLDFSQYPKGIYLLKIKTKSDEKTEKIIK